MSPNASLSYVPSVRVHTSSPSCSGSLKYGIERDGRSPTSQPGVEKERVSSFLGSDGKAMFSGRRRLQYLSQTVPIPIAEK